MQQFVPTVFLEKTKAMSDKLLKSVLSSVCQVFTVYINFVIIFVIFGFLFLPLTLAYRILGFGLWLGSEVFVNITASETKRRFISEIIQFMRAGAWGTRT